MTDYKEMYFKLFRASEEAVNVLIKAQQWCEQMYMNQPEPDLKMMPLLLRSENHENRDREP